MERLSALIHKLKEQFEENVPPSQMLGTVHQIESELSQMPPAFTTNADTHLLTRSHRQSCSNDALRPSLPWLPNQNRQPVHVKYAITAAERSFRTAPESYVQPKESYANAQPVKNCPEKNSMEFRSHGGDTNACPPAIRPRDQ